MIKIQNCVAQICQRLQTLPLSPTEESQAIREEWENDRGDTDWSHTVVMCLTVWCCLPVGRGLLKRTVLDHRYGHYALLGLTEDFVFVYDLKTETVSDYYLCLCMI